MIAVVSSTIKKNSPSFELDHDGRQTLKGEIHLSSNTTTVCSIYKVQMGPRMVSFTIEDAYSC